MLAWRQLTGNISEGLRLGVDEPVPGKYRPPFTSIDRNLRLIQSRRCVCGVDSNSRASFVDVLGFHRDGRWCVVDGERSAFNFAGQRRIRRIRWLIAGYDSNLIGSIRNGIGVDRVKVVLKIFL